MSEQTVFALAGLGFFLAGLQMLSEVSRTLVGRRVRLMLSALGRGRISSAIAGFFLGATTQSTSAAAYVCIGLLNARSIGFSGALSVSAWAGVGTAVLVFVASINLRFAALCALAAVGVLYLSSLHRADAGQRLSRVLLAFGVTLLGLAMLKEAGSILAESAWMKELFLFSANSPVVEFCIGLLITLPLQSSSTVTILAITLSDSQLLSLPDAVLMIGGAHVGSGLSVAWTSSHLVGQARQLALWQTAVKLLGALLLLPVGVPLLQQSALVSALDGAFSNPTLLAMTYLSLNLAGALLAVLWRSPLQRMLNAISPVDPAPAEFEAQFLFAEAAGDPETAFLLARQEQARFAALLPDVLSAVRQDTLLTAPTLSNEARHALETGLLIRIAEFISEAVDRHPQNTDIRGLLLLKSANDHFGSLTDTLHKYVSELGAHHRDQPDDNELSHAMTEALHLLLSLLAEQLQTKDTEADFLEALTHDRSDMMMQVRNGILQQPTSGNASREALFLATGLFERAVWIIRQLSINAGEIAVCVDRESVRGRAATPARAPHHKALKEP